MSPKQIVSLAVAAVVLGAALLLSTDLAMFINPWGLLLVLGGTLAGVLIAFPMQTVRELWDLIRHLNQQRLLGSERLVRVFVALARLQRTEGARTLENAAKRTGHEFLSLGVSLVADERPRADIRERLEQEFDFFISRREAQRAVLGLMGRLAPAFGLAGTMIGLIRMLHTIKDPSAVTEGMSVALLSTFYGIMLANLLILPLERKLNELTRAEATEMTLITEGVMGLALEENGAAMQARLSSFRYLQQSLPPAGSIKLPAWLKKLNPLAARSTDHGR